MDVCAGDDSTMVTSRFECGKTFASLSDLEIAKENYEKKHFTVLVKAKSEKWPPGHRYRDTIVYKYVTYECKKGVKRRKSEARGIRLNVVSGKLGCTFRIKLSANKGLLVVKESNLEHSNHELSEEHFIHLPEQLRLTKSELKEAELVLRAGGDKKKLQAHLIQQRGGKPVLLKQLHNLSTKLRRQQYNTKHSDHEKLAEEEMKNLGATIEQKHKAITMCEKIPVKFERMDDTLSTQLQHQQHNVKRSDLEELAEEIKSIGATMECDNNAITMCKEIPPVEIDHMVDIQLAIRDTLTEFAANQVLKNYFASKKVNFSKVKDTCAFLKGNEKNIVTTVKSCTCGYVTLNGLPCCHILRFREIKNIPIFDASLCLLQWTKKYSKLFTDVHPIIQPQECNVKYKTELQKYKEVDVIARDINSVVSSLSDDKYHYYLKKLIKFHKLVSAEKLMDVIEVSDQIVDPDELPETIMQETTTCQITNPLIQEARNLCEKRIFVSQIVDLDEPRQPTASQVTNSPIQETVNIKSEPTRIKLSQIKVLKLIKKHGNQKRFGQTVIAMNRGKKRAPKNSSDIFQNKSNIDKTEITKFFGDVVNK